MHIDFYYDLGKTFICGVSYGIDFRICDARIHSPVILVINSQHRFIIRFLSSTGGHSEPSQTSKVEFL